MDMERIERQKAPALAKALHQASTYLSVDFLGGPRPFKFSAVVNFHKALAFFFVALLMIGFNNFTSAAWVYLALHGSYGFCWVLKHAAFRDQKFDSRVTFGGAVMSFVFLGTYWIAPYLLISGMLGANRPAPSPGLIAFSIILFALGLTLMIASDCQKHFTLKYRKGLITNGMFKHVRHPNYLGEMMIYASFALLVQHWIPWLVLGVWWTLVFIPNMLVIEESISRYPEWEEYKAQTGMLLPLRFF
jgi:protein-S-isoprenylcysteine O-methyltransferase Ste14